MPKHLLFTGFVVLLVEMHLTCLSAEAQSKQARALTNSGNKPFIVKKQDLTDFTGRNDSIVADFDTRTEAQAAGE